MDKVLTRILKLMAELIFFLPFMEGRKKNINAKKGWHIIALKYVN